MTETESMKILAVIKACYPASFSKQTSEEITGIINIWAEMFGEPYELVDAAVRAYIATDTSGFPPSIGQIKANITRITQPEQLTEAEAVNLILKAARNSTYNAAEEYKKLPPMLQKLVGSPAQLRDWGISDTQTINTVVSSNLQRSYKVMAARERELNALPENVKQFILDSKTQLIE